MSLLVGKSTSSFTREIKARRLEAIKKSNSVEEASKLGFFDSILDKLSGGVKKEACRKLFILIGNQGQEGFDRASQSAAAFTDLTQLVVKKDLQFLELTVSPTLAYSQHKHELTIKIKSDQTFTLTLPFSAPSTESQHVESFEVYQLKDTATSLEKLNKSTIDTESLDDQTKPKIESWNKALKEMQIAAKKKAMSSYKRIDPTFKFTEEALKSQLGQPLDQECDEALVSLWRELSASVDTDSDSGYGSPDTSFSNQHFCHDTAAEHFKTLAKFHPVPPSSSYSEPEANPLLTNKTHTEDVELEEDKASKKIAKNYRAYRHNVQLRKNAAFGLKKDNKCIKMTVKSDNPNKRVYLVDPKGILPTTRKPIPELASPVSTSESTSKQLVASDGEFITLAPKDPDRSESDDFADKRNEKIRIIWSDIKNALGKDHMEWGCSIVPGLLGMSHESEIHSASGGADVERYLEERGCQPLGIYKQACIDLAELNRKGIYLRDIKNSNFVIKKETTTASGRTVTINNPEVKFIDLDGALTPNFGIAKESYVSAHKITKELLIKGNAEDKQALKSGDQYAMILTMFEGRFPEAIDLKANLDNGEPFPTGYLTDADYTGKGMLIDFIHSHVDIDHRVKVVEFMTDPVSNPLPDNLNFSELFDWRS
ncbi:hypothetical protein SOPP22_14460 [Shewanella sp. OPT22]|nr:hypothetical protein SOPP22_14460 [Shewanella sp. OPT22]